MRTEQSGLDVKLPQAATGKATKVEDLVVSIDENRQVYWGNQPIALEELSTMVESQLRKNPNSRFIVQADRTVQYDDLVKVLDKARLAGGTKVALAVKPAESPELSINEGISTKPTIFAPVVFVIDFIPHFSFADPLVSLWQGRGYCHSWGDRAS